MLTKFFSLADFADAVGETVESLQAKRSAGTFFAPDTVYNRQPYWFRETVDKYLAMKTEAIHHAFGGAGSSTQSDSVDTLGMRW